MDRSTLNFLRQQARIKGKAAPLVANLPGDALEFVYEQIRSGASNRGIARALKAKLNLSGSENSVAQSVAKLRKRCLPLIGAGTLPKQVEGASFEQAENGVPEVRLEKELDTIKRVEAAYGDLIQSEVAKAKGNGLIPSDLAKHVKALAELSKVRHRLEKTKNTDWLGSKTKEDLEIEELSNVVLNRVIGDDKEKMIRGAQKFLEHIATRAKLVDIDPETGEILSVTKR